MLEKMIDENKLVCAFIYSAYSSGYCGLLLKPEQKASHMRLYQEFIKNSKYYPKSEIEESQKEMVDAINVSSVRDYIYDKHYEGVINRIKEEIGEEGSDKLLSTIRKSNIFYYAAISCSINFYEVLEVGKEKIKTINLFFKNKKELILLDGLEIPSKGNIISGHWDYYLERIDNLDKKEIYIKNFMDYFSKITKK